MRRLPLIVAFAALASACTTATKDPDPIGHTIQPIINGVVDAPAKYDSVVLIEIDVGGGYAAGCSGTLVTPHLVVTAHHCVNAFDESSRTFGAAYDASKMYIWYGSNPAGAPDNTVAKVVRPGASADGTIVDDDISLLVLSKPATKPVAPIRTAKPPTMGEKVAVAGYGLTTMDTGAPTSLHQRYRRENLSVLAFGPQPSFELGAKELVLGEGTCEGDSGGPVFDETTGALLAVTSRGGNGVSCPASGCSPIYAACYDHAGYKTYNIFTRVDGFTDLIKTTAASLGESLWEEGSSAPGMPSTPPPDPGAPGATCAGPADCSSKLCVDTGSAKVCSQTCDDANPCPSGFDCNGGYCVAHVDTGTPDPGTGNGATPTPESNTGSSGSKCSTNVAGGPGSTGLAAVMAMLGLAAIRRRRG